MKKYYDILGIPAGASLRDIKRAYYKLARKYHPDVNPENDAKEKFITINEAYEILKNPDLRHSFSNYLKNKKRKRAPKPNKHQQFRAKQKAREKAQMSAEEFKLYRLNVLKKDRRKIIFMVGNVFLFLSLIVFIIWYSNDPKQEGYNPYLPLGAAMGLGVPFLGVCVFFIIQFVHSIKDEKIFKE